MAAVSVVVGLAAAVPGVGSAATLVVGQDPASCPGASFSSIAAAVSAASPGDTVSVCPGTYTESVTVDKSVNIVGPGVGFDPGRLASCSRPASSDPSTQAVWQNKGYIVRVEADNVSISGFVLQSPPGSGGVGSLLAPGYSGAQINGNVFQMTQRGLYVFSNGAQRTTVSGNCFRSINGRAVPIGNAVNAAIASNAFSSVVLGFEATGATGVASQLTIQDNHAVKTQSFAFLGSVQQSSIIGNTSATGNGVVLTGGDSFDLIASNTFANGEAGIIASSGAATPNTNIAIYGNTVSGMSWAAITGNQGNLTNSLIDSNVVSASGYGIWMQTGDTGNTIQNNTASGNVTYDCADDTTGSGTRGTANTWRGNHGGTSSPAGLCH